MMSSDVLLQKYQKRFANGSSLRFLDKNKMKTNGKVSTPMLTFVFCDRGYLGRFKCITLQSVTYQTVSNLESPVFQKKKKQVLNWEKTKSFNLDKSFSG